MTTYFFMFGIPALFSLLRVRFTGGFWAAIGLLLALLIGLRYEISGDWNTYLEYFGTFRNATFEEAATSSDPAYYLINWLVGQMDVGFWLVNLTCACIFTAGLIRLCVSLEDTATALAVAVPYMIVVMAMGHTRQASALGLFMWALVDLRERKILKYIFYILIATAFHKTALLLLPFGALAHSRNRVLIFIFVSALAAGIFVSLLVEQVDFLWESYIEEGSESGGGPVRVLMNGSAALVFLLGRRRFSTSDADRSVWTWMSLCAMACIPLVWYASTAVDRVALYFMPLQLVVWSRFQNIVSGREERILIRMVVLFGYACVLVVWLNFSTYKEYWVPYKFWPVEALSERLK